MDGMLSSDWSWFDYFLAHSNETDEIQKLLAANTKSFRLDKARSMVSIGPGSGRLDAALIENCCSELELYIGVEPNEHMFDTLCATMKGLQGVKTILVNDSVPEWMGPKDPVDIVLASHVLYFAKEPIDCIQQFYKWLKPGGSVIFLQSYQFGLLNREAEENNLHWTASYSIPELKRDLRNEGFHNFEEIKFNVHFMFHPEKEDFVRGYFKMFAGEVPEEKMQRIIRASKERWQGKEVHFEFTEACIKLTKPDFV